MYLEGKKLKKLVIISLVAVMLLPLLVIGCSSTEIRSTTVELTLDDFAAQNNITANITIDVNGTLTVKLGSNPSTGYSWGDPVIGNNATIEQASYEYVEPTDTLIVGAPGTDVWVFNGLAKGTTTIQFNYSRPWESVPATYTLTINIVVE
jgi:inhibitor of cysteine peptidase